MKKHLIGALLIPLLGIAWFIYDSEMNLRRGNSYEIPVTGYDPRDLLKGHYIRYRFKWDFDVEKSLSYAFNEKTGKYFRPRKKDQDCLCLQDSKGQKKVFPLACNAIVPSCLDLVRGSFRFRRAHKLSQNSALRSDIRSRDFEFKLGIEKFFASKKHALKLQEILRKRDGVIKFRINGQRRAVIEDLLFDGRSWKGMVE